MSFFIGTIVVVMMLGIGYFVYEKELSLVNSIAPMVGVRDPLTEITKELDAPSFEEEDQDWDITWPEFVDNLEAQFGIDFFSVIESGVLVDEVALNVEAQFGLNLGVVLEQLEVFVVVDMGEGKTAECTLGGTK